MKCLLLSCCAVLFSYFSFGQAAINGPDTVCTGSIIFYTDASYGGLWSISDTTIATINDSGKLVAIAPGIVTITFDSSGYDVTKSVTVSTLTAPAAITGTYGFCQETYITDTVLSATPGGVWSVSPITVDTIDINGVLSHRSFCSGYCHIIDTVTYTQGGCSTTYLVNSNPPGNIYPPTFFCMGSTATASSGEPGGVWTSGDSTIISITPEGAMTPVSLGSTYLYYTLDGCTNAAYSQTSDGISGYYTSNVPDTFCNGPDYALFFCYTAPSYTVASSYGDGLSDTTTYPAYTYIANIFHVYTAPGTYSVKHVVYDGYTYDSVAYSYEYSYCRTLPIKIYIDGYGDSTYEDGDNFNYLPVTIEVDSNGIAIDTLSATSGLYYPATGPDGTVYSFRMLTMPGGMSEVSPAGGVLYDTITAFVNTYMSQYFGVNCGATTGFDLSEYTSSICGRHSAIHNILINNTSCTSETPVVTMAYNSNYYLYDAYPLPTTVTSDSLTWDLGATFSYSPLPPMISAHFETLGGAGEWFLPGDTIRSTYLVTPISGDVDTTNNRSVVIDTAKLGFDPNEMAVVPAGLIPSGTKLQYTINFENTGNAAAVNISVMDTLSPNVDVHSLRIVASSAIMNTAILNNSGYTIVKFDFPGINLLDSSHHGQCDGMLLFTINVKDSLADGTTIFNHAGIFFDDNPVVMTDTVEDMIGVPVLPTGIQSVKNNHIVSVYPNPATTSLTIKSTDIISNVAITNLLGREVYTNTYNTNLAQIDIAALAAGVYFIKVNGTDVRKFVKE